MFDRTVQMVESDDPDEPLWHIAVLCGVLPCGTGSAGNDALRQGRGLAEDADYGS